MNATFGVEASGSVSLPIDQVNAMKNALRTALFALLLAIVPAFSLSAAEPPVGKVRTYGLLEVQKPRTEAQKIDSPNGERIVVPGAVVATQTDKIPATLGTPFGFEYTITGLPANEPVTLKKVVTYPAITKPDGTKQTTHSVKVEHLSDDQGKLESFEGFKFTEPYELAPGEWTFEMWHDGQKLVSQKFLVVKPEN